MNSRNRVNLVRNIQRNLIIGSNIVHESPQSVTINSIASAEALQSDDRSLCLPFRHLILFLLELGKPLPYTLPDSSGRKSSVSFLYGVTNATSLSACSFQPCSMPPSICSTPGAVPVAPVWIVSFVLLPTPSNVTVVTPSSKWPPFSSRAIFVNTSFYFRLPQ